MTEYECPSPIRTQEGEEYFSVEKIVEEKKENGKLMYKVRWEGYPPEEDTWKDAKELVETCRLIVKKWKEDKAKEKMAKKSAKKRKQSEITFKNIDETLLELSNKLGIKEESDPELNTSMDRMIPKKKARPQLDKEIIKKTTIVKQELNPFSDVNDITSSLAGSSKENLRISGEHIDNVNDYVSLEDMVNNNEAEVMFCDIRYQMKFNISPTKAEGVIYIKNADKSPSLEEVKEEDIKFIYASYKSKSPDVPYILVKLRSVDVPKNVVVSYKMNDFFKKFPSHCSEFLNAVKHYQQHYSTALENIERLKNEVDEFRKIWSEIRDLTDEEKVKRLPKTYQKENSSAKTVVDEYLQEMIEKNKELYFNMLAKEFGDLQTKSCNGCSCLKKFGEIHKKRDGQFSSIKTDTLQMWIDTYCELYCLPKKK